MPAKRTYESPLRETQALQTREQILDALLTLLETMSADEISTRELAAAAGVSLRTVYRHFPDRDALLNGVSDRVEAALGGPGYDVRLTSADDLGLLVQELYRKNEAIAALVRAEVLFKNDPAHQPQTFHRRTELTQQLVASTFPELTPRQGHNLAALLRILAGGRNWLMLREAFGLDGAEAGPLAAWAVGALLAEVRRGNPPPARQSQPANRSPAPADP
jgi:AcrR family transcriptional regulator